MVVKSSCSGKWARTVAALEWFLIGMSDNMSAKLVGEGESLGAMSTLVGFIRRTWTHVDLQHGSLCEGLATLSTAPQTDLRTIREPLILLFVYAAVIWIFCRFFFNYNHSKLISLESFNELDCVRYLNMVILLRMLNKYLWRFNIWSFVDGL